MNSSKCVVLLLLVGLTTGVEQPEVQLEQGALRGKNLKARSGRTFHAFQGIPFAAAPVGDLRFRPPQTGPSWQGTRLAQKEGSDCPQFHFVMKKSVGNEDCLYLNVYTPKLVTEGSSQLPVMVWVHGGAFYAGSGSTELYGPELLLDRDIVLVTFNYRLDALGFLSLGTKEVSGNYGLKDQVAALRWVKDNIAKFGGDPESVTIFGESAGGASVHFLMLSPLTKGLFHRAIAQSGSAHNDWAFKPKSVASSIGLNLTRAVGCELKTQDEVLRCLRARTTTELLLASAQAKELTAGITLIAPTVELGEAESPFITEEPRKLLAKGLVADVPFISGVTTHEGMLSLFYLKNKNMEEEYIREKSIFVPSSLHLQPDTPTWTKTFNEIESYYKELYKDPTDRYVMMHSDVDFNLGVDDTVRGLAALKRSPVYYYQFSYEGSLGLLKLLAQIKSPGTCHGDEVAYLFTQAMLPGWKRANPNDLRTIDRLTKLWTDFATSGTPTADESLGVTWLPMEANGIARYLDIGTELVMKEESLNEKRLHFWRTLHEKRTVGNQKQEL